MTILTACAWVNQECVSFAVVSDYMHHDKYMTIVTILKILKVLFRRFPTINKLNLFSDGAAKHFKQRFFFNTVTLLPEFLGIDRDNLKVEYDFFATSHGKGAVDGVGGSLKRLVMAEVMSKKVIIKTSIDYANTARKVCSNVHILHIKKEEVESEQVVLDQGAFAKTVRSLPGIRGIHHLEVTGPSQVDAKLFKGSSGVLRHSF